MSKNIISIIVTIMLVIGMGGIYLYNYMENLKQQQIAQQNEYEREEAASQGFRRETRDEMIERQRAREDRDSDKIKSYLKILEDDQSSPKYAANYLYAYMNLNWYYDDRNLIGNFDESKIRSLFVSEEQADNWIKHYEDGRALATNHEAYITWNFTGVRESITKAYTEVAVETKGYADGNLKDESIALYLMQKKDGRYLIYDVITGQKAKARWDAKNLAQLQPYMTKDEIQAALKEYGDKRLSPEAREIENAVIEWRKYQMGYSNATKFETKQKLTKEWEEYKKNHPIAEKVQWNAEHPDQQKPLYEENNKKQNK